MVQGQGSMVRWAGLIVIAGMVAFGSMAYAADPKPDGTVELSEGSVAAGIGYSWGKGTLTYKGKQHPFKISGFSAGELGATKITARGEVFNLKKLEDFNGNYTGGGTGAAAAGGFDVTAVRNANGVDLKLISTTQGADLKAAIEGIKITLE